MGEVEGAARLKMRFTLQVRKAGQRTFHRVDAPGFRTWTTANPGVARWVYSRRVEALLGPARYRAMVRFQWLDSEGAVIARAKRYSRACRQPDHRPNLKLKALSREGKRRYAALVVNNGRTATGPFDLQLAVGDLTLAPVAAAAWSPRAAAGHPARPALRAGTAITATADPLGLVDERNEADNAFTIPCA